MPGAEKGENGSRPGGTVTAELFRAAGIKPGDIVVCYGHVGQQANVVSVAAK